MWRHHREKEYPLHAKLAPVVGISLTARPREWLDIPPDYGKDPDAEIVIYPPVEVDISDQVKRDIPRIVTAALGIEAPDMDWGHLHGREPYISCRQSQPPPPMVSLSDIRSAIDEAAEHEIVLGIGRKDQVIKVSIDTEIPHLGICMPTGDGKSEAAKNVAVQLMYHGAITAFLDYKLMSHMWARRLPNAVYAGTPEEIHQLLVWLACDDERESELTRRKKVALASADISGNVRADIGPRLVLIAEELNALQKRLKAYWKHVGGKGPSPAAEALDEIHFTGRQLRIHAVDVAQRLSAKATSGNGSADSRENIGAIIFSNPTGSTWRMLCDGLTQPPASDHKGRYQLVTRKTVREFQGVLYDRDELAAAQMARDLSQAGTVAVPRHDMPFAVSVPATVREPARWGPELALVVGQSSFVPGPPDAVTLREAVAAGLFKTIYAARKAAGRPGFPEPAGERDRAFLYSVDDLCAWKATKERLRPL
jgi:hypothetical protein